MVHREEPGGNPVTCARAMSPNERRSRLGATSLTGAAALFSSGPAPFAATISAPRANPGVGRVSTKKNPMPRRQGPYFRR